MNKEFTDDIIKLIEKKEKSGVRPIHVSLFAPRRVGLTTFVMRWIFSKCRDSAIRVLVIGCTKDMAEYARSSYPILNRGDFSRYNQDTIEFKRSGAVISFIGSGSIRSKPEIFEEPWNLIYLIQSNNFSQDVYTKILQSNHTWLIEENTSRITDYA